MKRLSYLILLSLLLQGHFYFSQMPESDIWLFKLKTNKQKQVVITDSLNFTHRKGYDNQPSFSADEKKIYYVSVREDQQADIYVYQIKQKKIVQLTKTKESEYSPQLNADGHFLSAVTVEKDSSQKIHILDAINGAYIKSFNFDSVGYYQYLNKDTIIYYKLTEPHSLRMQVLRTAEDQKICDKPIRGFKTINRSQLLYGIKDSTKVNYYIYDFLLNKAIYYTSFLSTNEDALWHPTLGLMKSEGAKILRYNAPKKEWTVYLDLSIYKVKKITRFLFDSQNKYLIIVNNP